MIGHGALTGVPGKFDLKINRPMKRRDRNIGELHASTNRLQVMARGKLVGEGGGGRLMQKDVWNVE